MEQMIIFVYDTDFCQTEADDPQKAVLFFYPQWVSDQQRLALCGQLMGATHFCSTVFSTPKILTLQCGKFVLKKFGRYILSVGSDQSLPEWIIQDRFNKLELLFQFYHNSFDSVFKVVNYDQEVFSKKLTEILGIYIPILQCIVCAFGNVFLVQCPKKNSAAFLEAFQLLEACCSFKGVLGGIILHNSRVIATQLDPDITKLLALTNKFKIRSNAEVMKTSYNLPENVQLIKVFLKQNMYDSLSSSANFRWAVYNGFQKKFLQKASKIAKKSKDFTKIFTVQEEEDVNSDVLPKLNKKSISMEANHQKFQKSKAKVENNLLKERSKSYVGGLNMKVCSTPTIEKTLIHDELVSICSSSSSKVESKANVANNIMPEIVQNAITSKFHNRVLSSSKYFHNQFFRISMDDLMMDFTKKGYPTPLKYFNFGLPKPYREAGISVEDEKRKNKMRKKNFYKTLADPRHPVFRYDGVPLSKSLYNTYLDEHYKDFVVANITIDSREEFLKSKYLENERSKPKTEINLKNIENIIEKKLIESESKINNKENFNKIPVVEKGELTKANQKAFRRSLSLPLKPLLCDTTENTNAVAKNRVLLNRTPTTPLTTKLSLLAFGDQQMDIKTMPTPNENHVLKNMVSSQNSSNEKNINETIPSCLFVCGQQSMTMMLILDEGLEKNSELILSLCEASSSTLKNVEYLRNKSMANLTNNCNNNNHNSSYSFLLLDNSWGTIQRSGSWSDEDLKIVGSLNNDLNKSSNITEMIIRNEDSVVYGYSCGGTKIFYQQDGCSGAGLPTPADLMGVVTLKARRQLERDRDVILL